jgi:arylsulfotransferase ASST
MFRKKILLSICLVLILPGLAFSAPTVFPTGTTIYKPEKCYNGWTVLTKVRFMEHRDGMGVPVYSMNGEKVHEWPDVVGFPPVPMPGGKLLCGKTKKPIPQLGSDTIVEVDFDGKVLWSWDDWGTSTRVDPKTGKKVKVKSAQQHHNMVRWPQTASYYSPGADPDPNGDTLFSSYIPPKGTSEEAQTAVVGDQMKVIVGHDGKVKFTWDSTKYISPTLRIAGRQKPDGSGTLGGNSLFWLGPNPHYENGDKRFHPKNIIMNNFNDTIFIIDHKTGDVVWQLGPDYSKYPQLAKFGVFRKEFIGTFGGQVGGMLHHCHMIPVGLPGNGNILVFNNGGNHSLVTEFNPVTMEIVWEYSGLEIGYSEAHSLSHYFFSPAISSAQRLPNGNTLICEGDGGRVFEVTPDHETVWEFISPVYDWPGLGWNQKGTRKMTNMVYRAHRIPYEYIPQLKVPEQHPVSQKNNAEFKIVAAKSTVKYDKAAQNKVSEEALKLLGGATAEDEEAEALPVLKY